MGEVNLLKLASSQKSITEFSGLTVTNNKRTMKIHLSQMPPSLSRPEVVEWQTISHHGLDEAQVSINLTHHFYAFIFTFTALLFFGIVVGIYHATSTTQQPYRSKPQKKSPKDKHSEALVIGYQKGRLLANGINDNFINALFTDQTL